MDEDLINKLKALDIEDFIWFILIILILLSFYANNIERDYLIYGDEFKKREYRFLEIVIFLVALFTYLYYANDSLGEYLKLKSTDSVKKRTNVTLALVSSILVVIAGIILVYIAVVDDELDIELAFN